LANKSQEKIKETGQGAGSGGERGAVKMLLPGMTASETIHCVYVKP